VAHFAIAWNLYMTGLICYSINTGGTLDSVMQSATGTTARSATGRITNKKIQEALCAVSASAITAREL
jgi:hypothetical protein